MKHKVILNSWGTIWNLESGWLLDSSNSLYFSFTTWEVLSTHFVDCSCLWQAEKNELREEKLVLKADKERLEKQLKGMAISPSGFVPTHPAVPAAYHPGASKMAMYPSYSLVPMWHYLPPSVRDTSRDHELRPPAA